MVKSEFLVKPKQGSYRVVHFDREAMGKRDEVLDNMSSFILKQVPEVWVGLTPDEVREAKILREADQLRRGYEMEWPSLFPELCQLCSPSIEFVCRNHR